MVPRMSATFCVERSVDGAIMVQSQIGRLLLEMNGFWIGTESKRSNLSRRSGFRIQNLYNVDQRVEEHRSSYFSVFGRYESHPPLAIRR